MLNLTRDEQVASLSPAAHGDKVALSTHLDRDGERLGLTVALRAGEGLVVALQE